MNNNENIPVNGFKKIETAVTHSIFCLKSICGSHSIAISFDAKHSAHAIYPYLVFV